MEADNVIFTIYTKWNINEVTSGAGPALYKFISSRNNCTINILLLLVSQKINSIPLFAIWLLTAAYVVFPAGAVEKRATSLLKDMLANVTQNTIEGYGCFCFGGSGKPVDDLDSCCKAHIDCYKWAISKAKGCSPTTTYYKYGCNYIKCFCDPTSSRCGIHACICDLELTNCVASKKYNAAYKNYDRKKLC